MFLNRYTITTFYRNRADVTHVDSIYTINAFKNTARLNGAIFVIIENRPVSTANHFETVNRVAVAKRSALQRPQHTFMSNGRCFECGAPEDAAADVTPCIEPQTGSYTPSAAEVERSALDGDRIAAFRAEY